MEYPKPKRLNFLKEFAENIYHIMNPSPEEPERVKNMGSRPSPANKTPRSGATLFTPLPPRKIKLIGREKDLAALAEMLKKSERVVLVNGLGGIGKTEVCKSFFYAHYNEYDYAAWIDWISSLKESFVYALGGDKSTFIRAAETDTIDERFEKIMARLRQTREAFMASRWFGVGISIESRGHFTKTLSQPTPQFRCDETKFGRYKEGKRVRG